MVRESSIFVCPTCEKISIDDGPFLHADRKPELIDAFRFCSHECRHTHKKMPYEYVCRLKRSGSRNETFRKDSKTIY